MFHAGLSGAPTQLTRTAPRTSGGEISMVASTWEAAFCPRTRRAGGNDDVLKMAALLGVAVDQRLGE